MDVDFDFTQSGETTAESLQTPHGEIEKAAPPIARSIRCAGGRGFVVSLFDGYTAHRSFAEKNEKRLAGARIIPLCIPPGVTSLVQPVDTAVDQKFKARVRDQQETWELQHLVAYPDAVPKISLAEGATGARG